MKANAVDGGQDANLQVHPLSSFLDYLAEQIAKELISENQNELMEGIDDDASKTESL
jgi:hypothetical protein